MLTLNGIELQSWYDDATTASFKLSGTTMEDALALDGQDLVVMQGEAERERYAGYRVLSVGLNDDGTVQLRAGRRLDLDTEAAIRGIEANAETAMADAAQAKETAGEALAAVGEAGGPAVRAASAMYVNATAITNSQLPDVRDLIEDFVQGGEYAKGLVRRWDGVYYRMAKDIDKQTSTTYAPGPGTESLYTAIDLAPDGIRVWHAPQAGETDSFALGEKCHHPGEDGPVYVSQRNGNTSEPGTDEWWVLDGGAA